MLTLEICSFTCSFSQTSSVRIIEAAQTFGPQKMIPSKQSGLSIRAPPAATRCCCLGRRKAFIETSFQRLQKENSSTNLSCNFPTKMDVHRWLTAVPQKIKTAWTTSFSGKLSKFTISTFFPPPCKKLMENIKEFSPMKCFLSSWNKMFTW